MSYLTPGIEIVDSNKRPATTTGVRSNLKLGEKRQLLSICRAGSTMVLRHFSHFDDIQALYQPIKAGIRENGIPDFTYFEIATSRSVISKETFGPHNFYEAAFTAFRTAFDVASLRPVFLLRAPIATFNSWWNRGWRNIEVFEAAHENLYRHFRIARENSPTPVLTIQYEQLVDNPTTTFQAMCNYWGISFDSRILDMSHPLRLEPSFPGTADYLKSQKEGSFEMADKLATVERINRKNNLPHCVQRRINEGPATEWYQRLATHQ